MNLHRYRQASLDPFDLAELGDRHWRCTADGLGKSRQLPPVEPGIPEEQVDVLGGHGRSVQHAGRIADDDGSSQDIATLPLGDGRAVKVTQG